MYVYVAFSKSKASSGALREASGGRAQEAVARHPAAEHHRPGALKNWMDRYERDTVCDVSYILCYICVYDLH